MATPPEPGTSPPPAGADVKSPGFAGIWERLRHHKVLQWTLAYAAAAYTLFHGVEMVSHYFEWPLLIGRLFTVLLALGVPVVSVFAWYHGHKSQHRISGPELTMITVLLVIAGSILWVVVRTNEARPPIPANASTTPTETPSTIAAAPRTAVATLGLDISPVMRSALDLHLRMGLVHQRTIRDRFGVPYAVSTLTFD